MASSLDPNNFPEAGTRLPRGHGSRSLGPSDRSDSGSDMAGPGLDDEDVLDLDRDSLDDMESDREDAAETGALEEDEGAPADLTDEELELWRARQ
jgi:hypothetical protein